MSRLGGPLARLASIAGPYRRLVPYLQPHAWTFVTAGSLTLLVIAAQLLKPWPIKIVLDQVILGQPWTALPDWATGPDGRRPLLLASCAALLLIAVVGGVAEYARTIQIARSGNRIVANLRSHLHEHLVRMSLSYHSTQQHGDLLVRLTGDAAMLKMLLLEGVVLFAQELLTVAGIATVAFILNPQLTLVAIVIVPVVTGIVVLYGGRLRRAARRQRRKEGQIAVNAAESLMAVPEIQAYGLEERAGAFFDKHARKSQKAAVAAARLEGQMGRATDIALAFGTGVVLWVGAQQVLTGSLSPGEMLVFVAYVRALFKPMRRLAALSAKMVKSAAGAERLLEVLATPPDLVDPSPAVLVDGLEGDLQFTGVSYAFEPGGSPAVDRVSLKIPAGQILAILGPNGAGKSTLASLIPRLRDVSEGSVLVGGRDVRTVRKADLRRHVSVVFQRSVLFDGTIAENVRLGAPEATEDEIARALELSGVTEVAARLPLGVLTPVGEAGEALSGGQRQRVALARALARNAPILVFDEPSSALDPAGVTRLVEEVLPALEGRTVILVTHDRRLASIAHRAVILERGRVVFDGTPGRALSRIDAWSEDALLEPVEVGR